SRCPPHRKRESRHHVTGCKTSRTQSYCRLRLAHHTTGARVAAHRKSHRRRDDLYAGGLRKRAYHFLRDAAASFLATHLSTTQISHNAIRNPTTGRSNPMSFQKDLAPPGIYDGTCAIAKSTS